MKILVTGCLGFIMSGFIRRVMNDSNFSNLIVRGVARIPNQKHLQRLEGFNPEVICADLAEEASGLCDGVDIVLHGAARTFVNRSILDPDSFVRNNVLSTINILEDARRYNVKKFILCSTDEVLGSIKEGSYTEEAAPNPGNPYSSSKLACEGLCQSYARTYGLNTLILRFENVYGKFQGPEKVIPTFCRSLIDGDKCPVYGKGDHVRQWLHLDDCINGILHLMNYDTVPGEIYHVAGNRCLTNLELAVAIIDCFQLPGEPVEHIRFVDDSVIRPGHDFRYALSTEKIRRTGWSAHIDVNDGIAGAVDWYKANPLWLR